jgi:hypothetical protein
MIGRKRKEGQSTQGGLEKKTKKQRSDCDEHGVPGVMADDRVLMAAYSGIQEFRHLWAKLDMVFWSLGKHRQYSYWRSRNDMVTVGIPDTMFQNTCLFLFWISRDCRAVYFSLLESRKVDPWETYLGSYEKVYPTSICSRYVAVLQMLLLLVCMDGEVDSRFLTLVYAGDPLVCHTGSKCEKEHDCLLGYYLDQPEKDSIVDVYPLSAFSLSISEYTQAMQRMKDLLLLWLPAVLSTMILDYVSVWDWLARYVQQKTFVQVRVVL